MLGHPLLQRKIVVMVGGREKRYSRRDGQCRYRHDNRKHRFEKLALSDTHIDSQIVAAGRFDPSHCRNEVFGARYFQHRRAVDLLRRTHCRIPHSCRLSSWQDANVPHFGIFATRFDSASHAIFAPFRNGTHSSSESLRAFRVHCSRSIVRPERCVCPPAYAMAAGCTPYPASGSQLPCAGERMNQPTNKTRYEIGAPTPDDRCVCDCEISLVHVAKHEAGDFHEVGKVFQESKSA